MSPDNSTGDASRRAFLKGAGAAGATTLLAGCGGLGGDGTPTSGGDGTTAPPESPRGTVERLDAYPRVRVASVSDLSVGDVQEFAYPLQGQQNFVTRLGVSAWDGVGPDDDIVAFNAACTHAGCSVAASVEPEEARAGPCPCHFTNYDISKGGIVTMGQGTSDLPQVELDVEDGDVYAMFVEGLVWGYHDNLRNGTPVEGAR